MSGRVLVTGAGGFVGSAVAVALRDAGHAVIATDLAFDASARARLSGVRLVEGALPSVEALGDAAPEAVLHGAAITAAPARYGMTPAAHLRANVEPLLAVMDWARGRGAGRFAFFSSSGVFGDGDGEVDETAPATATDPYSAAKRAGEILLAGAAEPGFETMSLRLGPVYGPHEAARPTRPQTSPVARMIATAQATGEIVLQSPEARRDWTFLPDIGRAVVRLLAHAGPLPQLVHLTSGKILSDAALAEIIAQALPGTRVRHAPDPAARPPRPAMVARHVPVALEGFDWTPAEAALARMLPAEVRA
jgi:nucleoside-diphosphate-sugar epimerase